MKKIILLLLLVVPMILFAQTTKKEQRKEILDNAREIRWQDNTQMPSYIGFRDNYKLIPENAIEYSKSFFTTDKVEFTLKNSHQSRDNKLFYRYFQTFDGYPVEFTSWHIHVKNDRVIALNGDIVDLENFETIFAISEKEALQIALNYIGAEHYMWQDNNEELLLKKIEKNNNATYYPVGEKVITPVTPNLRNNAFKTAYKFNIFSKKPYDRKMVYVDAQTGEILFDLPLIHFSDEIGTAHTQYSGIQEINTSFEDGVYILEDNTRGQGVWTMNLQNSTNFYSAVEFEDDDNIWNNVNPQLDQYATDAHYATMSTYDYYINVHNRNSIDNNGHYLLSFVHFDYDFINAFWNGQFMTYGDGNISYGITPLTTLDICGHEVTHGLTQYTANLVYSYEPGALNESFSDIFGTMIEYYGYPEGANWLIGEKIGMPFRSMQNPKLYSQPNTYHGQLWYWGNDDNGGVHYNSGVLNYWFYLISEGGSGTNDNGHSYSVTGMGMDDAEQLAFKILTEYLTPTSNYYDACYYALQASNELFGGCTPQTKAVGDAFYAVGVITEPYSNTVSIDFTASENEICRMPPVEVKFTNNTLNGISYLWDFGDGNSSTDFSPSHIYEEHGYYTVTLTVDGGECGSDTVVKEDFIYILSDCYVMSQLGHDYIEACYGTIYDNGGPNANYLNSSNTLFTIYAPGASRIVIDILELDTENEYVCRDYICFYDGSEKNNEISLGCFCNFTGNPGSVSSTGEYITIFFYSNSTTNLAGYKLEFQCHFDQNIEDAIVNENIIITPNPSNGIYNIYGLSEGVDYRYMITDISGNVLTNEQTLNERQIDLRSYPEGVYVLVISTDIYTTTIKLVNKK